MSKYKLFYDTLEVLYGNAKGTKTQYTGLRKGKGS